MQDSIVAVEDANLRLACQIYEMCRDQYGENHERTRFLRHYMASFEIGATRAFEPRSRQADYSATFSTFYLRTQRNPEVSPRSSRCG